MMISKDTESHNDTTELAMVTKIGTESNDP